MIFTITSGLDLAITMLALCGITGAAVGASVRRSPGRSLPRSVVGAGALVAATFVLVSSVGADIELRKAVGISTTSAFGSQWQAWVASALLILVGVLMLRFRPDPVWLTGPPLRTMQIAGLMVATLAVVVVIVFMLPVWDVHFNGWSDGYHGHTYYGRGMHFH